MAQQLARSEAFRLACERLRGSDWSQRCAALGLPLPVAGRVAFRLLDRICILTTDEPAIYEKTGGKAVSDDQAILVLRLLAAGRPIRPTGTAAAFREIPGARFYEGPFRARSVEPLLRAVGNDPECLRQALDAYEWEMVPAGDFGARVHALGNLYLTLVYHAGDDEFPPTADLLFDSGALSVLTAEDAVVLAQCLCLGLIRRLRRDS